MTSGTDVSAPKPVNNFAELAITTVAALALALTSIFLCVVPLSGNVAGARDFVVFWATGQQLVHHGNPFDAAAMGQIEHTAGLAAGYGVLYMRNPPWSLPLAAPLGLLGLRLGAFLWSLLIIGCLVASVLLLWQMHGRPKTSLHWIGLSFGPALVCALMGQTTLFALLGYVLFVRLGRAHPFLAGMSLWLCALKPHLFLPFGAALLPWIFVSKTYKVMAGFVIALAAGCALTYLLDPTAWADYAHMMRASGLDKEYIPCLIVVLRLWLSPTSIWLQYLAPALGCTWALGYFWPRRHAWDWRQNGGVLVLVSLVAAPYSWVYDGGLAIPALLQAAYLTRSRLLLVILATASILIEVELVCGVKITSILFLWTVPAWLMWYLLARAFASRTTVETERDKAQGHAAAAGD